MIAMIELSFRSPEDLAALANYDIINIMSYINTLAGRKERKRRLTLVVDHSISVQVRLLDHIVDLLLGQLLAQICHYVPQLLRRDQAVVVLIEHPAGETGQVLSSGRTNFIRGGRFASTPLSPGGEII